MLDAGASPRIEIKFHEEWVSQELLAVHINGLLYFAILKTVCYPLRMKVTLLVIVVSSPFTRVALDSKNQCNDTRANQDNKHSSTNCDTDDRTESKERRARLR